MPMNAPQELISCCVEEITFRNAMNGFTVLETEFDGEPLTVVGVLPDVAPGETVECTGSFDTHPTYGRQFKATAYVRTLPSGAGAILRYLSSGAIKGIGPATARKIVHKFGDDTLQVLEQEPARLAAAISGISLRKAEDIAAEMQKRRSIREIMVALSCYGINAQEALNIYRVYGNHSVQIAEANPYLLCSEAIGISFERADEIALGRDLGQTNRDRICAGLAYVLRHNLSNGHTCLPRPKLLTVACRLLELDSRTVDDIVEEMLAAGQLFCVPTDIGELLFLPDYYASEQYVAARLAMYFAYPPQQQKHLQGEIERVQKATGLIYAEHQYQAIAKAMENSVFVLTGGPGTGKTTTLNAIITLFQNRGLEVALAAPTGRAAKRMSEVCGIEAKTIHRLLEVVWSGTDMQPQFLRNERNPLECDVLVLDELSMVDIRLFEAVLRAIKLGCRLILVGDAHQLPSVGAGNLLYDLLAVEQIPRVCLTKVFRQAEESLIVTNAHKIVQGLAPDLENKEKDFFFIQAGNPVVAARQIADLYTQRLPKAYGFSPLQDIQVLCPARISDLGSANLNNLLQSRLNPPAQDKPELQFRGFCLRLGDKVMQIKNNYEIVWQKEDGEQGTGIFNGDIGFITAIDPVNEMLTVRFDDRTVHLSREEQNQLELAYAVTVHKSQGSEYSCVLLPLLDTPPKLCYRNLLYTAVTRAKKLLVCVGNPTVVNAMVTNDRKNLRYSALAYLLREQLQ